MVTLWVCKLNQLSWAPFYCPSSCLIIIAVQISDLLGSETALCNTLWLLKDAAHQTFHNILKTRGDKLLRYPPLVAVDLSPPPAVREGVSLLLELIETYNGMMVPASGKKPDFDPVIAALLDPIVQVSLSNFYLCMSEFKILSCEMLISIRFSHQISDNQSFKGCS